jgi:hypothetical protein
MPAQDARTLSLMRSGLASRALVAAAAVVVLLPNHPAGRVPSEDAGVFFYTARALLSGGTPYLDVWDHKPPLVYFVDEMGLGLAGLAGVWVIQGLAFVGAALLSLRALTPAFGRLAATIGTLAWIVASPRLFLADGQQTSFVEFYALPLQAAALALVAARPSLRFSRRDALALGALAALAFLLKPTLVGLWLAIGIAVVWRQRGAALQRIGDMVAGGAAVLGVIGIFFLARGALGELFEQALRYNLAYASFTPFVERLGAIPEGVRLTSPSGLSPVALAAGAYAIAMRRGGTLLTVALLALPLELLLATSGRAYHYYFLPWLVPMGALAAFATSEVSRLLRPRYAYAAIAAAVLVMSVQPTRLVARLATVGDDGVSRSVAAYVSAATSPTDTVLIWGSRAETLILADRRSPTRYVYQYAALATRGYSSPAAITELLADLEARRPALIIDASRASFVTPPLDRAELATWSSSEPQYLWPPETDRILAFVEANYVRDGSVPGAGWPVWRRR